MGMGIGGLAPIWVSSHQHIGHTEIGTLGKIH